MLGEIIIRIFILGIIYGAIGLMTIEGITILIKNKIKERGKRDGESK